MLAVLMSGLVEAPWDESGLGAGTVRLLAGRDGLLVRQGVVVRDGTQVIPSAALLAHLKPGAAFINTARAEVVEGLARGDVFVRCHRGANRSALVVALALAAGTLLVVTSGKTKISTAQASPPSTPAGASTSASARPTSSAQTDCSRKAARASSRRSSGCLGRSDNQ